MTALITGASNGLGLELARIFAREGYDLVLTARSGEKLLSVKSELENKYGVKIETVTRDLTEKDAADKIFKFTSEKGIDVDILVNNAGFGDFGKFAESDLEKQTNMVAVNVNSLMRLTHLYMKAMIERGSGKILNMASIAAFEPGPLMSVYYATKAFVLSFTEALSVELKGTGVSVTAVCPGPTKTGFETNANLGTSGLFKNMKNATASEVAEYAYKSLMKNKIVAVPGGLNKAAVMGAKFAPKEVARRAVYLIQKSRK